MTILDEEVSVKRRRSVEERVYNVNPADDQTTQRHEWMKLFYEFTAEDASVLEYDSTKPDARYIFSNPVSNVPFFPHYKGSMQYWDTNDHNYLIGKYVVSDLRMPAEDFQRWMQSNNPSEILPTDSFHFTGKFNFPDRSRYLKVSSRWIGTKIKNFFLIFRIFE
jgi:hypothetical protein